MGGNIPAAGPGYLPRDVLDTGRVFFDSLDPLLPAASDGQSNVYESEPSGVGSCGSSARCLSLISSGSGTDGSFFYDASASGDDVFFLSSQSLTSVDTGGIESIYDARVGGGFPAAPPTAVPCASSSSCEGAPAAPPAPVAGSVVFTGPGDVIAGTAKKQSGRVKITAKVVRGDAFAVTVRVPAGGRVTVTGTDVRATSRAVARAGSYRLVVRLTAKAAKRLGVKQRLRVAVRVRFKPRTGIGSSARADVELKARRAR